MWDFSECKAVFIDMDGTLVDSHPALMKAYKTFMIDHGLNPTEEEFTELIGPSIMEIMETLRTRYGISSTAEELRERYHGLLEKVYSKNLSLFPGAIDFLELVKKSGKKIVLVTSSAQILAEKLLAKEKLSHFFDAVITPVNQKGKPAPDIYLSALQYLGVESHEAVAIEDSEKGVQSAISANIPTVHIHRSPLTEELFLHPLLLSTSSWQEVGEFFKSAKHVEFETLLLNGSISIRVVESDEDYSEEAMQEVDSIWESACMDNPQLFNGKVLVYSHTKGTTIFGKFIEYKIFYATRVRSHLQSILQIIPFGIMGITFFNDKVLIGKRSNTVTLYKDLYETIPSGTIEPMSVKNRVVDVAFQYLIELKEEAGIEPHQIKSITPYLLIKNRVDKIFEIIAVINLNEEVSFQPSVVCSEYSKSFLLDREEVFSHLDSHKGMYVPMAKLALDQYLAL